jgi:uncharacterized protein (DUF1697 family)
MGAPDSASLAGAGETAGSAIRNGSMEKYAAFLRGVSPMNLSMPALKQALEHAGFAEVRTLLSSGNVVFTTKMQRTELLEKKIESALASEEGSTFTTFVRSVAALEEMLAADPFAKFRLAPNAKRVVTFTRTGASAVKLKLPIELDGARILAAHEREVFTAYVPHPRGPVFMKLLEKTLGKENTTRTWETVRKCVR